MTGNSSSFDPEFSAAQSLRGRAEGIRRDVVAHYRVGNVDPDLVQELSTRLVQAVLAPVLAALDNDEASETQLADAVLDLFELRTIGTVPKTQCIDGRERR